MPVLATTEREAWEKQSQQSSLMISVLEAKHTDARREILDLKKQMMESAAAKELRRLAGEKAMEKNPRNRNGRSMSCPSPNPHPDPGRELISPLVVAPVKDEMNKYWDLVESLAKPTLV